MKIPFFLVVAISLFLRITTAKCQDSILFHKNYQLTVLMKVKDVTSVINLSVDRQILLANFFQKEMIQTQALLQSDSIGRQMLSMKTGLHKEFESLLTPAEFIIYSSKKKGAEYAKQPLTNDYVPVKKIKN